MLFLAIFIAHRVFCFPICVGTRVSIPRLSRFGGTSGDLAVGAQRDNDAIGENDQPLFIAMELLEGQTLHERISGKPLRTGMVSQPHGGQWRSHQSGRYVRIRSHQH